MKKRIKPGFKGILLLLMVCLSGCREPLMQNIDLPVDGKLLFVEDFSGRDGLLAGRFGDVVLLDGATQKRYALTDDHYYAAHPNLVDGGRVWFEGKRERNIGTAGLGAHSNLYSVDTESRRITDLNDSLSTFFGTPLGLRVSRLSLSPLQVRMTVVRSDYEASETGYRQSFFLMDLGNRKITKLTDDRTRYPSSDSQVFWSPDEDKIAYHITLHGIFYTNLNSGVESKIQTDHLITTDRLVHCVAGSWHDDHSFVLGCKEVHSDKNKIFLFNIDQEEFEKIATIEKENFRIDSINISKKQNKMLFVGTHYPDGYERMDRWVSEIWLYDLTSGAYYPVTDTRRIKGWLRWYEDL